MLNLEEHYRIGKKKNLSKVTDLENYTILWWFCPKCHIWWEINQTNFLFGVYRSVGILLFINFMQIIGFSLFSCDADADRSQTSTGLSVYVWWVT